MKQNAIGLAIVASVLAGAARAADEKPTIDDVKTAWQARQDKHKSFRVEWTETVKLKAGAYEFGFARNNGPHPPEDTEYKTTCSFAADGVKAAGTVERPIYSLSTKTWAPYMHAGSFDGKTATVMQPLGQPGWGDIAIHSGKGRLDAGLYSVTNDPVLRVFRPLRGGVFEKFEFEKAKLSERTEKVGDATCVEIITEGDRSGSICSIWCDPERGFLPVREKERGNGGYDLNWEYRKDDKGAWLLSGWEYKKVSRSGEVTTTHRAEVKKLEFGVKFAADAFAPKPPPGSRVNVFEDGAKKAEYLIRPDGSKRAIAAAEENKSSDDLAKTNADGTPYVPAKNLPPGPLPEGKGGKPTAR